jgi:hypothetical protein
VGDRAGWVIVVLGHEFHDYLARASYHLQAQSISQRRRNGGANNRLNEIIKTESAHNQRFEVRSLRGLLKPGIDTRQKLPLHFYRGSRNPNGLTSKISELVITESLNVPHNFVLSNQSGAEN